MSYGGTANVKKCSAWAVKSIWKRDFQPHEQASVFETIYEVSIYGCTSTLPANCMSGLHAACPCLGYIQSTQTWELHIWKESYPLALLLWSSNVMIWLCCSANFTDFASLSCAACHSCGAHGQPCSSLNRPAMFPGGKFIVQMRVA